MDNRLNKIRKDMSALRADMLRLEGVMRDQINRDRDATQSALRLMAMRREISMLVAEWRQLGGIADAGHLEQVGRIDGAAAQDDLAAGTGMALDAEGVGKLVLIGRLLHAAHRRIS